MFSVATCACNYNLRVTKKSVRCKHQSNWWWKMYSPKVVNETDDDFMDKIATHSYQGFVFYFKRITIENYNLSCDKRNCYIFDLRSTDNFSSLFFLIHLFLSYVLLFWLFFPTSNIHAVYFMCTAYVFTCDVFLSCKLVFLFSVFEFQIQNSLHLSLIYCSSKL